MEDLIELRKAWNNEGVLPTYTPSPLAEEGFEKMIGFGQPAYNTQQTEDEIDMLLEAEEVAPDQVVFGSSFFGNPNISEAPQLFVATPSGYKLGPGDEITIDVWGASETRYEGTLSRQGVIKIDRLPPLYLSGLSLSMAQQQIRKAFKNIYTGLASDAPDADKVFLDVNLKKARSIIINITGNVEAPGTYTLSGFSSVLNALYAAGGPNENGSFRNIKVLRGGKVAASIDLYDYLVEGNYPDFFLNDQDVVMVTPYSSRVRMTGAFKTQGIFETLPKDKMADLLRFAGGFASEAYKEAMFIDRIEGLERTVLKLEATNALNSMGIIIGNR